MEGGKKKETVNLGICFSESSELACARMCFNLRVNLEKAKWMFAKILTIN